MILTEKKKQTFLINFARGLILPWLRTLRAGHAVTHLCWVLPCGYQFQTSKGSRSLEKHPTVQMLVWTVGACTSGPAVLPARSLVRQQALSGSAWARVTARTGVLVLALEWLFPSRPREPKKSSSELDKTVLVHLSAEEVQLVPLSSRANCPVCGCGCVGCVCFEQKNPHYLNSVVFCCIWIKPEGPQAHSNKAQQKCPGLENSIKPCKGRFPGIILRSKWYLILRCLISTVSSKGLDCLNRHFIFPAFLGN